MINELLQQVGRPYEKLYSDGTYQGCFYPVYFLFPHLPKYKLPDCDKKDYFVYSFNIIDKLLERIDKPQKGDIVITRFCNQLHCGIYYEFEKMIHVLKDNTLSIERIDKYNHRFLRYYRVK